jgi:hypothetical protein
LEDGHDNPLYEFSRSLLHVLGKSDVIAAYNAGFEKSALQNLADYRPEFEDNLKQSAEMTVDLLPITRAHYYHPVMHGSCSIKYVLPTIEPELDYDEMGVADSVMVQNVFDCIEQYDGGNFHGKGGCQSSAERS